jgi:hypothetical protein
MGVILGMFRELARLGVSRAAAFFYAVAVGVAANIVIAHFTPHDGSAPAATDVKPAVAKPVDIPVATAVVAPKPAAPSVQTLDVSALATTPSALPGAAPSASIVAPPAASMSPSPPARDPTAANTLPSAAAMAAPPLKPAALPSAPVAAAAAPPAENKPADKPASNVEAAAAPNLAAPISLLPQPDTPANQPATADSDQPAPKPAKPGPGSGGLY